MKRSTVWLPALAAVLMMVVAGCGILHPPRPPHCREFRNDTSPGNVDLSIQNAGTRPLYLPLNCGGGIELKAIAADGRVLATADPVADDPGCSPTSCEAHQTMVTCPTEAAPNSCAPRVLALEPGGFHTVLWKRLVYETRAMPEECWLQGRGSCVQAKASHEDGTQLTVSFTAQCQLAGDGGVAPCHCPAGLTACQLEWPAPGVPLGADAGHMTGRTVVTRAATDAVMSLR